MNHFSPVYGAIARAAKKKQISVGGRSGGEFQFHIILGETVVHNVYDTFMKILSCDTPRNKQASNILLKICINNTFFSQFTEEVLIYLMSYIELNTYFKGQSIVRQGEYGRDVYVINKGSANVQITPSDPRQRPFIVTQIASGSGFGKLALLHSGFRAASVIAAESGTEVIKIPEICCDVLREYWNKEHNKILKFLKTHMPESISITLKTNEFINLIEKMHISIMKRNTVIISANNDIKVRKLYIIKSGSCRIIKHVNGLIGELGTLQAGSIFGYTTLDKHILPPYSIITDCETSFYCSATSDLLSLVSTETCKAIENYILSFDIDNKELKNCLEEKLQWTGWQNALIDVTHVNESRNKLSPNFTNILRGSSGSHSSDNHTNNHTNKISSTGKEEYLKAMGYDFKNNNQDNNVNNNNNVNNTKLKKQTIGQSQHHRNGLKMNPYQHATNQTLTKAPSAAKIIHRSLSDIFLGIAKESHLGSNVKGRNDELSMEQREQVLLSMIEKNLAIKEKEREEQKQYEQQQQQQNNQDNNQDIQLYHNHNYNQQLQQRNKYNKQSNNNHNHNNNNNIMPIILHKPVLKQDQVILKPLMNHSKSTSSMKSRNFQAKKSPTRRRKHYTTITTLPFIKQQQKHKQKQHLYEKKKPIYSPVKYN